jgi:hypothetical protein
MALSIPSGGTPRCLRLPLVLLLLLLCVGELVERVGGAVDGGICEHRVGDSVLLAGGSIIWAGTGGTLHDVCVSWDTDKPRSGELTKKWLKVRLAGVD